MAFVAKITAIVLAASILLSRPIRANQTSSIESTLPEYTEKTYIYLLMIPDYDLRRLRSQRLRQDEDEGGMNFAQTGMFVGQIIQGVLNFDSRPLFAGSVGFVEDPNGQRNLASFLGTIAPAMNLILKRIYDRAQMVLGFPTTPKPTVTPKPVSYVKEPRSTTPRGPLTPVIVNSMNGTSKINATTMFTDYDYDANSTLVEAQTQKAKPANQWEDVFHMILRESTTTVEPLPFIRRTTTEDDYDGEESRLIRVS